MNDDTLRALLAAALRQNPDTLLPDVETRLADVRQRADTLMATPSVGPDTPVRRWPRAASPAPRSGTQTRPPTRPVNASKVATPSRPTPPRRSSRPGLRRAEQLRIHAVELLAVFVGVVTVIISVFAFGHFRTDGNAAPQPSQNNIACQVVSSCVSPQPTGQPGRTSAPSTEPSYSGEPGVSPTTIPVGTPPGHPSETGGSPCQPSLGFSTANPGTNPYTIFVSAGCAPPPGYQYWLMFALPEGQPNVPHTEYHLLWPIMASGAHQSTGMTTGEVREYFTILISDSNAAAEYGHTQLSQSWTDLRGPYRLCASGCT